MKKILLSLIVLCFSNLVFAQWQGTNPVYYNAGKVGIGTSSPIQKLQVHGNIYSVGGVFYSDNGYGLRNAINDYGVYPYSNYLQFRHNGNESMRIDSNGNVGIGTTSPWAPLTLKRVSSALYEEGIALAFEGGEETNIGYRFKANGSNYYQVLYNGSNIQWKNWNGSSYTSKMTLTNSGDLGIGTTAPLDKLQVNNGIISNQQNIVSNGVYTILNARSNRTVDDYGGLNSEYFKMNLVTEGPTTTGETSEHRRADLRFALRNTIDDVFSDRLTIRSNGNIGIGTTSPQYQLEIAKSSPGANVDVALRNDDLSNNSGARNMVHVIGDNSGDPRFVLGVTGIQEWHSGIDNSDGNKFKIGEGSAVGTDTRLTIQPSGNVGIGTATPVGNLEISDSGDAQLQITSNGNFGNAELSFLNSFDNYGFKQFLWNGGDQLHFNYGSEFNGGVNATTNIMTMHGNGNVGIGTGTKAPTEKLSVDGTVLAKKVRVSVAAADWPDYVFAPSFKLQTLSELEAYIKLNQHLPEVPSAKEVSDNGLDLGDMDATLLKKVEELTLYTIDQEKKILQQSKENQELKDRLFKIEAILKTLTSK